MGPVLYHLHQKPHCQSLASHSEVYINKYVYNKGSNILMRQARKSDRAHHFLLCAVKSNLVNFTQLYKKQYHHNIIHIPSKSPGLYSKGET